jgi:hypothetical protein
VAAIPVVLLLAHAIGLAVQVILVETSGASPQSPAYEGYQAQVFAGFAPGVAVLIVGLYAAIISMRRDEPEVALWGRVFTVALLVLIAALVWLTIPLTEWAGEL